MFQSYIGASGRLFRMPLQFPDTGEPGNGAGTPSNNESAVGSTISSEPVTPVQAPITPTATGDQGPTPKTVDWETHQAAIRGMNEAQRIKAEWEKVAQEGGFKTPEEARAAFQAYQAMQTQPDVLIKNYFAQKPESLTALLRENPMQAAQLFGQVFNGQNPAADPYAKYAEYDSMPELVKAIESDTLSKVEKLLESKLNPVVQPIQQRFQQQEIEAAKAKVNDQINAFIKKHPDSGVTPEKVWDVMIQNKYRPELTGQAIIEVMGGLDKYEEHIQSKAAATAAKNLTKKVEQNNNVASLTPGSGVSVSEISGPITDPDARRREALRRLELMQTVSGGS